MQAARRRGVFDFTRRLGSRTEAGPRRVLPRVSRRDFYQFTLSHFSERQDDMRYQRTQVTHTIPYAQ